MTSRAADATIKGYYYQFDTSILKLLELENDNGSIVVEGIEDIDIHTDASLTAVQCKYLSEPKFINSKVRKPITLMLDHFVNPATSNDLKYVLYAHFEDEEIGGEPIINLLRLKEILTYTEDKIQKRHYEEKSISDDQLNSFLNQFEFKFGLKFEEQQNKVIKKIETQFSCSDFTADTHFYNNALRIIIDLAIKKDEAERKISKADFIAAIDSRKTLFNEWYLLLRSKTQYLKYVSDNLKSIQIFEPSRTKFIIIGKDILSFRDSELPFSLFIENLIDKFYKSGRSLKTAKPITVIVDCNKDKLTRYKKILIEREIVFNDGFESISFSPELFNTEPIINKTPTNKISKTSYSVKLISRDTLNAYINSIKTPRVILHFSKDECPYSHSESYALIEIKYHCEDLIDISTLLTN